MLQFLAYFGIALWVVVAVVHLVAFLRAKFYLFTYNSQTNKMDNPIGISIVKTLVNYTPEVITNLESVFCLEYPLFEVVICIQDEESSILSHVSNIVKKYPNVDCRIFSGAENVGVNPKINNLMQCYDSLKYEHVWICDSNIKVYKGTLGEMASNLNDNVGMIHQLPFIDLTCKGYGASLEKVYFGTHHARWYLFFNTLNVPCCNGMSSIFNKSILEKHGGLKALANNIAEDHYMAMNFYENGYKLVLSTEPAYQNPSQMSYPYFVNRMTRWQILRLTMLPSGFLEPLIENICLGLFFSWSIQYLYSIYFWKVLFLHEIIWLSSDALLLCTIEKKFHSSLLELFFGWLFREISTYYIFARAVWDRSITWNKSKYKINFDVQSISKFLPTKNENKNI
ncbi:ceramide glucosyltransferase-like [Clytia hemisphaerica]|uniref:ceramide glucosyltransferase n=1 Tax=Clytia hemisphaerica TaxID=252671 RepID=A0A7M5TUT6_9CNID